MNNTVGKCLSIASRENYSTRLFFVFLKKKKKVCRNQKFFKKFFTATQKPQRKLGKVNFSFRNMFPSFFLKSSMKRQAFKYLTPNTASVLCNNIFNEVAFAIFHKIQLNVLHIKKNCKFKNISIPLSCEMNEHIVVYQIIATMNHILLHTYLKVS